MNNLLNNPFERKAGMSLIIFTLLLLCTMGLHPAGGSVEHLIRITNIIVITHSIALLSLPFGWIGFWGLTRKIGADHFGSMLAFFMISLGMVAVLVAAATNGLILPVFLQHYKDAAPEDLAAIKPILRYSFAVNQAYDYVYTAAWCLAVGCWSVAILLTRRLARWIGWLGIGVALAVAAVFISGVGVANSVQGLRIFIGGIVVWILVVGVALWKSGPTGTQGPRSFSGLL
jgi:hypothetical protein